MKKACRTRWLSLHAGVDAVYDEYEGIVKTLQEIQFDRSSGSLAIGLLKKIKDHEFLGTLYLLKCMLPNISALSKTFQTGSLNFSRIIPSINRCKTKIQEIEQNGKVWDELEKDLGGRLRSLNITLTDIQERRIKSLVGKYANSICQNIAARFPSNSCEILTAFSIFDVDLLPTRSSPAFSVYGNEEISCLGKQFFPNASNDSLLEQWNDFKFEMIEMKKKISTLKNQFQLNKFKFKMTSTEWTLEHILTSFKGEVSFPKVLEFAKLAIIVPVTNAWPEQGASAVKRIKSRQRSTMKNDLLNALLHISMNGPPVNSPEVEHLISRVVEQYCEQKHNKVPQIYVTSKINRTIYTQTEKVDIDEDNESIETIIEKMEERDDEFIATNFDYDSDDACSSSNENDDSDDEM